MRVHAALALVAAGLLACTAASAVPAATSAVTYTTTKASTIGKSPVADSSTGVIYSSFSSQGAPPYGHFVADINFTDGTTLKTLTKAYIADFVGQDNDDIEIGDIKVATTSHSVWAQEYESGGVDTTYVINGSTAKIVRGFSTPFLRTGLTVTSSTNTAYLVHGDADGDQGSDTGGVVLQAMEGNTGATRSVKVPFPDETDDNCCQSVGGLTVDSSAGIVYVAVDRYLYGFSTSTLKVVSTLALPYATSPARVISDSTTHQVYVVLGKSIYQVDEKTNKIVLTSTISDTLSTQAPLIDPKIATLYVGTRVFNENGLKQIGTLPMAATYANPTTHNLLAPGYVITRKG